jgi:hypothetical protein
MENPFAANVRLASASAVVPEPTVTKVEKEKKGKGKGTAEVAELTIADRVEIFTSVVPRLELCKDELKEIFTQDYDAGVRESLQGFIDQLENMQISLLEFAKVAIQGEKSEGVPVLEGETPAEAPVEAPVEAAPAEDVAQLTPPRLTASMIAAIINGREPVPEE